MAIIVPLPFTARKVLESPVMANEVEVALARVVFPETFNVPVAVMFAAVKFPLKYPLPFTSSALEGEVVPMPRLSIKYEDTVVVAT